MSINMKKLSSSSYRSNWATVVSKPFSSSKSSEAEVTKEEESVTIVWGGRTWELGPGGYPLNCTSRKVLKPPVGSR